MKKIGVIIWFLLSVSLQAQEKSTNFRSKTFLINKDSVRVDSVSINPFHFKVFNEQNQLIKPHEYTIDFASAILVIDQEKFSKIRVEYFKYPDFLTRTYAVFDKKLIAPHASNTSQLYSLTSNKKRSQSKPFEGLFPQGSISRGITMGNNQDAVLNSTLDLQMAGKLSNNVTLRASITDSSIPIQEGGYTQKLNEFDRVFVELFSNNWSIKGGDVNLQNNETYFLDFTKKVAGISVDATINHTDSKTDVSASGALVRGRFTSFRFNGVEGNQGPYKLMGPNGEPFIVIISGSEKVFVNGLLLQRGENKDYIIDYNTGEITFTATFPINATMRIRTEFQYSDRNYTRFVTYEKAKYSNDKFTIGAYFYNENDAKNQPLLQDLTDSQKFILADAGNDFSKMIAPSVILDSYAENKILYKKILVGNEEAFRFSTNPEDELFNVKFSFVGINQGSYQIQNTIAAGKVFEFVGKNNGNYEPVVQLIAPNKLQVTVFNTQYNPSEKTMINAEIAYSNNDQNLFSAIDDQDNNGMAAKIGWKQTLIDSKWKLNSKVNFDFIDQHFKSVQRFQQVEYFRDWNILNTTGTQKLFNSALLFSNEKHGVVSYNFEHLTFGKSFEGNKNSLTSNLRFHKTDINTKASLLNNKTSLENGYFLRWFSSLKQHFNKSWLGFLIDSENNKRKDIATKQLTGFSNRFAEYEGFFGIGDSTNVFTEIGYNFRVNDSLQNSKLTRVNSSKTYFIKSKFIQNENTGLAIYTNYRTVDNLLFDNTSSLNSRITYSQRLFRQFVNWNAVYETSSGTLPQQEFTYIKTEPGQGFYTWIDYNSNGIQELNEFETAQFPDEATYLRVALPSVNYIKTHQTKLSYSLSINPSQWSNKKGLKKVLSHFNNQAFILIDNKQKSGENQFKLNPFDIDSSALLGLNFNFRNNLYFNRGKQHFSTIYTLASSKLKNVLSIDTQENNSLLNQIQFTHKFAGFWLFELKANTTIAENISENFTNRNYKIENTGFTPKISYVYSNNSQLNIYYEYKNKKNTIFDLEQLQQQKFGTSYQYSNTKNTTVNTEFNFFINDFEGNSNSPVAYQMLEGLQAGNNYTWNVLFQRKLTTYLDLNLNYFGRKSENSNAIHTGTVQLRANF